MERDRRRTRRITLCAALSGVTLVVLLLACLLPSGRIGVSALAGLCVAVAVCAGGYATGLGCFAASALLSLLLLPSKEIAAYFCLCFGIYPLAKAWIEAGQRRGLEWVLKLAVGNLMMIAVYQVLKLLLGVTLTFRGIGSWGLLAVGNAVFVCYDIAFSRVMAYVQWRLLPLLRSHKVL